MRAWDLTENEVQAQQQVMLLAGMALNTVEIDTIASLLRKFEMADTVLPIFEPSAWRKVSGSTPLHVDLVKAFIGFRNAAARLRCAADARKDES